MRPTGCENASQAFKPAILGLHPPCTCPTASPPCSETGITGQELLGTAFEFLLWRWSCLHGWFVKRPNLRGTWRVELQSDWIDPATNVGVPIIICYMGVAQTLSSLQMHLMTSESESWFIAEGITPSRSNVGYRVAGVYTNEPKAHLRGNRSEIHFGGLLLETHGPANRPNTLTGEYWTDRKTKGQMTFTERVPDVCTRFEDAKRAFTGG